MVGRGQGVGPCPNLVKAWIGEHYSETWSQEVQLCCLEVLATPPTGGLPGHGGKQLPTTSGHPCAGPMSFIDLYWEHQTPSLPILTQGPEFLEHSQAENLG